MSVLMPVCVDCGMPALAHQACVITWPYILPSSVPRLQVD